MNSADDEGAPITLDVIEAAIAKLLDVLGPAAAARVIAATQQADVLASAQSPEFWAARFAARGIRMKARTLREKAIAAGLCYYVDKQVLISPKQIDELFQWGKSSCRSRSTNEADSGGSPAQSGRRPGSREYMKALGRLTKAKPRKSG